MREVADYRALIGQLRWDRNSFTRETIGRYIDVRELAVARRDGKMAGVMLVQPLDRLFWPDRPDGQALHVHKLARKRGVTIDGGLARPMLDWALEETRKADLPYLRLDCAPDETLCAIYAGCGFTRLDLIEAKPDFWSWRWEKAV